MSEDLTPEQRDFIDKSIHRYMRVQKTETLPNGRVIVSYSFDREALKRDMGFVKVSESPAVNFSDFGL